MLGIMETVLQEATSTPSPAVPLQQGDGSQLDMLLDRITSPYVVVILKCSLLLLLLLKMMVIDQCGGLVGRDNND